MHSHQHHLVLRFQFGHREADKHSSPIKSNEEPTQVLHARAANVVKAGSEWDSRME